MVSKNGSSAQVFVKEYHPGRNGQGGPVCPKVHFQTGRIRSARAISDPVSRKEIPCKEGLNVLLPQHVGRFRLG